MPDDSPAYRRILLKLSGEALMGQEAYGISPKVLSDVAGQLVAIHAMGVELSIVVGGGNIFRGLDRLADGYDRASADYMGMLATLMNALALQNAIEAKGVATRVQSALQIQQIAEPYIRRRAVRHLEKGRVVIFGAGTGNPFFSTDTAAALRAVETGCQVLFKATKVDGVYDKDPKIHPGAVRFKRISYLDVIERDLRVMDLTAVSLCRANKMPILVFDMTHPGAIQDALMGRDVGTWIGPDEQPQ